VKLKRVPARRANYRCSCPVVISPEVFQIFRPIVRLVSILVVNNVPPIKRSTKDSRHNESVLKDSPPPNFPAAPIFNISVRMRVVNVQTNISVYQASSPNPARIFGTFLRFGEFISHLFAQRNTYATFHRCGEVFFPTWRHSAAGIGESKTSFATESRSLLGRIEFLIAPFTQFNHLHSPLEGLYHSGV